MSTVSRFGDLAQVVRGVTFDKSQAKRVVTADHIPILRAGNIQDELELGTDLVWVPLSCVSADQIMREGDIAVAVSSGSAALVGKSARLRAPWFGSVGAFCAIVRPRAVADAEYVALWMRSPSFHKWRASRTRGANIQNLQLGELEDAIVPSALLEEQVLKARETRQRLDVAALGIRAAHEQTADANRLSDALLKAELGNVPLISAGLPAQEGTAWTPVVLSSLARLESGHTPSRRRPEWWGGPVPWLALPDIRKLHGKLAHSTTETINNAGLANSSARLLPVGTVCVSRTASIGFVTVLGRPMATSQDFCNWVCDPERLDPEFLMYAFMASQEILRELGSGAVHKTIYMPTIQSFHICAPAISEQRRIARTLRGNLAAAESLQQRLSERQAEIERLPQRILAAAFGEAD